MIGVKTLFIGPGSPWENGCIESFNGKFRDEFLNREGLDTRFEAGSFAKGYPSEPTLMAVSVPVSSFPFMVLAENMIGRYMLTLFSIRRS